LEKKEWKLAALFTGQAVAVRLPRENRVPAGSGATVSREPPPPPPPPQQQQH
jgi:hypothetical protein